MTDATGEPLDLMGSQHAEAGPSREAGLPGGSPVALEKRKKASNGTFDKTAYMREYMKGWRKRKKEQKA